ncbi:hypothetical protein [Radiobacillus sp. PE A8.2]|uniref:hypothetical protein n=1 Tax=Radiobacillus sp. PE A8.2 TaxID=3380349 RepID=UPI00388EBF4F
MRYLNKEELEIGVRFLFLSMAIIVIQKDEHSIQQGQFKIKEPYLALLNKMEHVAIAERKQLRKHMFDNQMQVVSLNKNDSFSSFLFLCKGREEKRNYFNPTIRKNVEMILYELMQKAGKSHQLHPSPSEMIRTQ